MPEPVGLPPDNWPGAKGSDGDSAGPVRRPRSPQEPPGLGVDDILPKHSGVGTGPMAPFVEPPPIASGPMAPWKGPAATGGPPPPPVTAEVVGEGAAKAAGKAGGAAGAEAAGAGPSSSMLSKALGAGGKAAVSGAAAEAGGAAAGGAGAAAGGVVGAELLAALGPAGIAVGAFAIGVTAAVIGVKAFCDTLAAEADKIKDYSSDVAFANSQNEVRQILAMQGRAEAVGPQLGQFQADMGELNEGMAEIWTQILTVLLDMYTTFRPVIEFTSDSLKLMAAQMEELNAIMDDYTNWHKPFSEEERKEDRRVAEAHLKVTKALKAFFEDEKFDAKDDMFTLQLEGVLAKLSDLKGGSGLAKAKGRDFGPGAVGPRGPGMARGARRLPGRSGFGA
jgi:hypothetical protein